jgi:hypothetical protein
MNKFPSATQTYKDTQKRGVIVIQGIQLESDDDGFIEAPTTFAKDLEPHGFKAEKRPEPVAKAKR